jgi:hypothetical protein
MGKNTVTVITNGPQETPTMEISAKTSGKDWEFTNGAKAVSTKENGAATA